jgi:hypothetical protein
MISIGLHIDEIFQRFGFEVKLCDEWSWATNSTLHTVSLLG